MALANIAWQTALPDYGDAIEAEIERLAAAAAACPELAQQFQPRWLAIQLLEGDDSLLANAPAEERAHLHKALAESRGRLQRLHGDDLDIVITDRRYHFVRDLVQDVLRAPARSATPSDKMDRILTHRWLGVPIMLALMYLVFSLVQTVSAPYLDWIDGVVSGPLSRWTAALFTLLQAPEWLNRLVAEGVIAGVGGVVVFLPGLLVMFFSLAFLEASGYMARAAFVMDRAMNAIGLQGQSFMPMMLGFGCNVPAIFATRTIENRGARLLTGLLIPFMSCSARLPVYVIFGLAFFAQYASIVIWGLYVFGILVAGLLGALLSRTVFRGASASAMVMEMPPYRWPTPRELWQVTWQQTSAFLRRAGTFILLVSVVFWLLLNLPWGVTDQRQSAFGRMSVTIAPLFEPAGFGDWQASGALLTGMLAKEAVVSSLSQLYLGEAAEPVAEPEGAPSLLADVREIGLSFAAATVQTGKALLEVLTPGVTLFESEAQPQDTALTRALRNQYSPLAALAFVVFVLLYVPCMATIGAQIQEYGWPWAGLSVLIMFAVPWLVAVAIYQGGLLLGLG